VSHGVDRPVSEIGRTLNPTFLTATMAIGAAA
jgi:hypothetical protein